MHDEMMAKYKEGKVYEAGMIADNVLLTVEATGVRVEGVN